MTAAPSGAAVISPSLALGPPPCALV